MRIQKNKIKLSFNSFFWGVLFWMIALPLHASNKLLSYISVTGTISILHIILIVMIIYSFLNYRTTKEVIISIMFLIALFLGIICGYYYGNNISSIFGDGGMYLLAFGVFFSCSSSKVKSKTTDELLSFIMNTMTVSCSISCFMYLTKEMSIWGIYSFNGGRYFGGYLSLLEFSVPYAVYNLMYKNKVNTFYQLFHIVIAFFGMILAQTRTTVICIVFISALVFLFGEKSISKKIFLKKMFFVIVAIIILEVFFSLNLDIVNRIVQTDISNREETTFARVYIYQYYAPIILNTPFGVGFGKTMYFVTQSLLLDNSTGSYTVDSTLMTVGYKIGWSGMILYFAMITIPIFSTAKRFYYHREHIDLLFIIMWLSFAFSTSIITAQSLHTYACIGISWLIVGNSIKIERLNINNEKKDKKYILLDN